MGGTGKYKGITGTVPYTIVELHDTVGGRPALIVNLCVPKTSSALIS
jgi:hypothetical protein